MHKDHLESECCVHVDMWSCGSSAVKAMILAEYEVRRSCPKKDRKQRILHGEARRLQQLQQFASRSIERSRVIVIKRCDSEISKPTRSELACVQVFDRWQPGHCDHLPRDSEGHFYARP